MSDSLLIAFGGGVSFMALSGGYLLARRALVHLPLAAIRRASNNSAPADLRTQSVGLSSPVALSASAGSVRT